MHEDLFQVLLSIQSGINSVMVERIGRLGGTEAEG